MATLFTDGRITDDPWMMVDGDQPVPADEDVIVTSDILLAGADTQFSDRKGRLGVYLTADEQISTVAEQLKDVDLVALDFPSFADGRAFSKARLLKDEYGFAGEVRAVGDIRLDQVALMLRCGFDSLLISHQPTIDALKEGRDPGLKLFYQPAAGETGLPVSGKAWARRPA